MKSENFLLIKKENKFNFINQNGKYLFNEWFNYANEFQNGIALVQNEKNLFNFAKTDGTFLFNDWYLAIENIQNSKNNYFWVLTENGYNFIDKNGNFIFDYFFDYAEAFVDNYALISIDDKYNYVTLNKEFLLVFWTDFATSFIDGFAFFELNNYFYGLDTESNIYYPNKKIQITHIQKVESNGNFSVYSNEDMGKHKSYIHIIKYYKYIKVSDKLLEFHEAFPEISALNIKFKQ